MTKKTKQEAQNPLILRCHRLMEAFSKSNDERDFYLDRLEGFIIYVDLDKPQEELEVLEQYVQNNPDRYCSIPKLTFYETKKIMEGFVNEKVYDIDTKEKLLDIIQSKEARENFLEFIYDHHSELEKWQLYYQERSRIRIIEWLRNNHFHFVFEEDLDLSKILIEKLKKNLFESKVGKDIAIARKVLLTKAKTYYSNEALNPRPKRGRPPKQAIKQEIEHHITTDIYTTVPSEVRPFLFTPDISSISAVTFSSKFESEEQILANRKSLLHPDGDINTENFNQKIASLRNLSSKWIDGEKETKKTTAAPVNQKTKNVIDEDSDDDWAQPDEEDDEDEFDDEEDFGTPKKSRPSTEKSPSNKVAQPQKKALKQPSKVDSKKIPKRSILTNKKNSTPPPKSNTKSPPQKMRKLGIKAKGNK